MQHQHDTAPDCSFKYKYHWLETDGTLKGIFDLVAFFWESRPLKNENVQKDPTDGVLILYILDEHGHEYEWGDFPEAIQADMKEALLRYLKVDRFIL